MLIKPCEANIVKRSTPRVKPISSAVKLMQTGQSKRPSGQ